MKLFTLLIVGNGGLILLIIREIILLFILINVKKLNNKIRKINEFAEINFGKLISINKSIVNELKRKSLKSKKNRYRICLHKNKNNLVNEMIIVSNKYNYFRPHKHPNGIEESYSIIEGKLNVYIFDSKGKIIKKIEMGPYNSGLECNLRISTNIWHMPLALSTQTVYHEVLRGPFVKSKSVIYAKWSPKEDEIEKSNHFIKKILIK